MRKLVWTVLVATVSAACASAAVRALEWAWRRATKRPPPDIPTWAHFLVGKPLRRQIATRIRRSA
jgi:hypothetical protein